MTEMNCLEFRRRYGAQPRVRDDAVSRHRAACQGCAAFARATDAFERQLERAVRLPVPEDLHSKVWVQAALRAPWYRRRRSRQWTLAASLALAVALGFAVSQWSAPISLSQVAAEHVRAEPFATEFRLAVAHDELSQVVEKAGLALSTGLSGVTYAKPCVIGNNIGVHLVLGGERGPVTVLIMPGEPVDAVLPVDLQEAWGLVVPCPRGSMAILGRPGEALMAVEKRVLQAVSWT